MGSWRLELLRLWRTRRVVALVGAYLILGLGIPVLTYYLPELIKNAGNGVTIVARKQTPADAIAGFASNTAQLGTLVVVIITAASLVIDGRPALAAFYRTRIRSAEGLLLPRYLIVTGASIVALTLGTLAAWYETTALLGHVPAGRLFAGLGLESLWICFATSIVAVFISILRTAATAAGAAIALLLALGLLGNIPALASWLPTTLAGSGADLLRGHHESLWHAALTASSAILIALFVAVDRVATPATPRLGFRLLWRQT